MVALGDRLLRKVGQLPALHRETIALRWGLTGGQPLTLIEISQQLGSSRFEVRRLELEALRRLGLAPEFLHRAIQEARRILTSRRWLRGVAARAIRPVASARTPRSRRVAASASRSAGGGSPDRPRSSNAQLARALAGVSPA